MGLSKNSSEWWDYSIELVSGCTPVSESCEHCWSASMASRFRPKLTTKGHFNGKVIFNEKALDRILDRKKPTRWVIWNDLFWGDRDE